MKNLLIKLFSLFLVLSFGSSNLQAQQAGKAGGNVLNFFNTSASGGQNAHLQSGVFGAFTSNSRWISTGQPFVPSGTEFYGMRIQDRQYVGTFSMNAVNGNNNFKDLEITYGIVDVLSPFPPPPTNKPALNFKFVENAFTSTLRMKLTAGGTLGINIANPSSSFKLDVSGKTRCTLGVWSASDKRYKKGIQHLTNASDKLDQVQGVTYKFKKEVINGVDFTEQDDRGEIGFIAQDLEKIFPDLVIQDEQGYYSVRYEGMIPVLVEGFKEQKERISEQETTITALNNKVEKLEAQLQDVLAAIQAQNNTTPAALRLSTQAKDQNNLEQNRPNPFKGITTIDYTLPENIENAELIIMNLEGKQIKTFELRDQRGSVIFDGSNLAAGTYFYSLIANGQNLAQQKMLIQ